MRRAMATPPAPRKSGLVLDQPGELADRRAPAFLKAHLIMLASIGLALVQNARGIASAASFSLKRDECRQL